MVTIAGIQFQKNGAVFYFDANKISVKVGDFVIAETGHGIDIGEVIVGCREVEDEKTPSQIKQIVRIATQQDIARSMENREKEKEAYTICQKKINEHRLEMKLVSVEYSFDSSKILFYFTANGRIDFRSLVKDLASVFKTRIELRQIGVRDEARMLGGLGQCGRPICCGSFLEEFQPVSIKMAKEQNLSLNPTKISGICGRLMCCLKYEQEQYEQIRKKMPRIGREVKTPEGSGTVIDLDILKERISVRFQKGDSFETKVFSLDDISGHKDNPPEQPYSSTEGLQVPDQRQKPSDELKGKTTGPVAEQASDSPHGKRNSRNRKRNAERPPQDARIQEEHPEKKTHERKLGQPVRRENPRKTVSNPDKPTNETSAQTQSSSTWAMDLEKAMRAIDKK